MTHFSFIFTPEIKKKHQPNTQYTYFSCFSAMHKVTSNIHIALPVANKILLLETQHDAFIVKINVPLPVAI